MVEIIKRFNLLGGHQKLNEFPCIAYFLNKKEYNKLLIQSYILNQFPNRKPTSSLIRLFERTKPELIMSKKELKVYQKLPQKLKVFRGVEDNKTKIKGLSWTLSKEKADWFANRFKTEGKTYEAIIDKKYIFCYTNERQEEEVILNPFKLKNIWMVLKYE